MSVINQLNPEADEEVEEVKEELLMSRQSLASFSSFTWIRGVEEEKEATN